MSSHRKKPLRLGTIAACVCVFSGVPLIYAWEEDVHYGLTKCLALKAGFSELNAEAIAWNNQSLDDSADTAAVRLVGKYITFGFSDSTAGRVSKKVRHYHFPSLTTPPVPAADRQVPPGSPYAKQLLYDSKDLEQFGIALHSFQDSWSHQGISDIPLRGLGPMIRPDLSWGHPEKRGGWMYHDADVTPLHVDDTVAMARKTYEELLKFGSRMGLLEGRQVDWPTLEPSVRRFAQAKTKEEKRIWFNQECGFTSLSFLAGIDIPDGRSLPSRALDRILGQEKRKILFSLASDEIPQGLWGFSRRFLESWLVRRNMDRLLEDVDVEAFARRLVPSASEELSREIVRKQLVLWLIEDHGLANSLGHGLPGNSGFVSLPSRFNDVGADFRLVQYGSLDEALTLNGEGVGIELRKIESQQPISRDAKNLYAVVFHLRHLNHDGLVLLVEKREQPKLRSLLRLGGEEDEWRVTGLLWTTS